MNQVSKPFHGHCWHLVVRWGSNPRPQWSMYTVPN